MNQKQTHPNFAIVDEEYRNQRLDNYLLRWLKGVPKAYIYRIIRKGEVRANKKRVKPDYRLQTGDHIRIPPSLTTPNSVPLRPSTSLMSLLEKSIVYEDEGLIVINKPAGLAVHGGSGINLGVIEAFRQMRPQTKFLELIHRLDRDTSGCLMIAKKSSYLKEMHTLLRHHQVQKTYLALLKGYWRGGGEQRVAAPLLKNVLASGERIVKVDEQGKQAATVFIPIKRFPNATLVEVHLETGRTHQIRVHAQHLKQPIIGDEKYGHEAINKQFQQLGCKRLMLHATNLKFMLPSQHQVIDVSAPTDGVWDQFINDSPQLAAGTNLPLSRLRERG